MLTFSMEKTTCACQKLRINITTITIVRTKIVCFCVTFSPTTLLSFFYFLSDGKQWKSVNILRALAGNGKAHIISPVSPVLPQARLIVRTKQWLVTLRQLQMNSLETKTRVIDVSRATRVQMGEKEQRRLRVKHVWRFW